MGHTNSHLEETLSPLQQKIYSFLKTSPSLSYEKEALRQELQVSHKGTFTRTLNQMASQDLIQLTGSADGLSIHCQLRTSTSTPTKPIQLSLLSDCPTENFSSQETETLTEVENVEASSLDEPLMNQEEPVEVIQIIEEKIKAPTSEKETTVKKPTPVVTLHPLMAQFNRLNKKTKKLMTFLLNACLKEESYFLVNYPAHLTKEQKASASLKDRLKSLEEAGFIQRSGAKGCKLVFNHSPLELCQHVSEYQSLLKANQSLLQTIHKTYLTKSHLPKSQTANKLTPLQSQFNTLTPETQQLFHTLVSAALAKKSWVLNDYLSLLSKNQRNSKTLPDRLQALEQAGLIQLSGKNKGRLQFLISPLELCEQLALFKSLLKTYPKVISTLHQAFFCPQIEEEVTPKVVKSVPKPVKSVVQPTVPEIEEEVIFNKRYFLLDSENCNHFLSDGNWLKGLKEEDSFLIFLSQNSPSIKPSMFHFFQQYKNQIETRYTTVRGKGESDLDHVLTMELAYLWMKDPEAQYIILSKDQGFLAAVDYWTQRHDLKKHQLCLKNTL